MSTASTSSTSTGSAATSAAFAGNPQPRQNKRPNSNAMIRAKASLRMRRRRTFRRDRGELKAVRARRYPGRNLRRRALDERVSACPTDRKQRCLPSRKSLRAVSALSDSIDISILSIATAVPGNVVTQAGGGRTRQGGLAAVPQARTALRQYRHRAALRLRAARLVPEAAWLGGTDRTPTAATRWICSNGLRGMPWRRRAWQSQDIDVLVVNTITGIAVPSLDARLIDRMGFRSDVERLPIFGFGCGGGVAGLSRAARLARAAPGANVLFLTIDLCSLCLRIDDPSIEMFVSAALFGDGAVGVVLRAEPKGPTALSGRPARIVATGEHLWRGTERIMGWDMKHDGFGVVLSPQLPSLMQDHLGERASRLSRQARAGGRGFRRLPVSSGRAQGTGNRQGSARPRRKRPQAFLERAARLRQHVFGHRAFRARRSDQEGRERPPLAGGLRTGFLRLFRDPVSFGAALES